MHYAVYVKCPYKTVQQRLLTLTLHFIHTNINDTTIYNGISAFYSRVLHCVFHSCIFSNPIGVKYNTLEQLHLHYRPTIHARFIYNKNIKIVLHKYNKLEFRMFKACSLNLERIGPMSNSAFKFCTETRRTLVVSSRFSSAVFNSKKRNVYGTLEAGVVSNTGTLFDRAVHVICGNDPSPSDTLAGLVISCSTSSSYSTANFSSRHTIR